MSFRNKCPEFLQEIENNLLDLYSISFKYGNEENQDAKQYLAAEEIVCELTDKNNEVLAALAPFEYSEEMEPLQNAYKNIFENPTSNKNKNFKNVKQYKDFAAKLQSIKAQADASALGASTTANAVNAESEEFIVESDVNIFDPLTKLRMKDPVRNRICGHHYENSSMIEAIQLNHRLRCPVAGCGNTNYVKQNDLVADYEFKTRLMNALAKESSNASQSFI